YWTGYVRSSPALWKIEDGQIVAKAITDSEQHPFKRAFDPKKLVRPPQALKSKIGQVTVPETEPEPEVTEEDKPEEKQYTAHLEVQWLLAKLGNDMGLD